MAESIPATARPPYPPAGWAQMTRRLLWSTSWQPGRTVACAALGTRHAISLVGAHNLPGLAGATADGGTWQVSHGNLRPFCISKV